METIFNIESQDDFKNIVEDILSNLYNEHNNFNSILNNTSVIAAKDDIRDMIFSTQCNPESIHNILSSKSFSTDRVETFCSTVTKKQNDLMYSTLINYNSLYGPTVANIDWTVKLVFGISDLKKLKYPLMQLGFTTVQKRKYEQISYDINKQILTKMIEVLESVFMQS